MKPYPIKRAMKGDLSSQTRFAEAIGTSQQNVSNWVRKGRPLPAEFVLKAEMATGVPRHQWRPDIYPAPATSEARSAA
ncbi:transcriptional regulator [Stakelama pacifica]|uniref:transcriptional regulator n=1 Tax=Stakelama pacifica TaxID=517720 RepID=UPI001996C4F6|nr:YdaS family helix-turn-helix protein [Stakelama pacifica]GGO96445.1 hypothetical protein GCM10011329_22990 [Stakelama pacifica]